jgi:diguanylate cyclase (GGDEF)-like protein
MSQAHSTPDNADIRLVADLGVIAERLTRSIRAERSGLDAKQRALLDQVLSSAAEVQQTIADLRQRISNLEALTVTDEVTGLRNRRGLRCELERSLANARRYQESAGLLIIDLDRFKTVNDRHGHVAGDAMLRQVGTVLRRSVRQTDVVARLGGDEFAVLLTKVTWEGVRAKASEIEALLNAETVSWQGQELAIRASVGAAPLGSDDNVDHVLSRADLDMYRRKRRRAAAGPQPVAAA